MPVLLGGAPIGVDLDNTIVDYAEAFASGARELGLSAGPFQGKTALRDALRAKSGEDAWTDLQAYVYGEGMARARPFPGVETFFVRARAANIELRIISHKTRHAVARPDVDLRAAASAWLAAQPFARNVPVIYAETRAEKIAEIARAGVALFIDDLVEVFDEPAFPRTVTRWLFAPNGAPPTAAVERVVGSWDEATALAFGA